MCNWVKCTKRKPDDEREVQVVFVEDRGSRYVRVGQFWGGTVPDRYWEIDGEYFHPSYVSHWADPELPEIEE